ncbi:MAG TPA: DUF3089 domain-containing protein [Polyangiaceae bacterium]|nr:DUF3089 domain-containing protein [Polyangiaceae bacterium]
MRATAVLPSLLALLLLGCGSDDEPSATPGADGSDGGAGDSGAGICTGDYCAEDLWLCRPGIATDYCAEEQTATILAADGTSSEKTLPKADSPKVDCFYVYPTVALTQPVGNMQDFSNLDDILVPLRAQAVPFSSVCRVYAPLYHQITLATYASAEVNDDLEKAYADVEAAFETYLGAWNAGRDFILMGHSQGTHMIRRLLQRKIETDDALRARMVVALPIGPVGDITVPVGAAVGGTFQKLPLCTGKTERGCVIAYDSAAAVVSGSGGAATGATDPACVNPAAIGSTDPAPFRQTLIPTARFAGQFGMGQAPDLPTTFVGVEGLYSGACARGSAGALGLQVSYTPPASATLASPVNLATQLMHVLDYSFPLGDLLDVTQAKIDASE